MLNYAVCLDLKNRNADIIYQIPEHSRRTPKNERIRISAEDIVAKG